MYQAGRLGSLRELTVSVAFRREGRGDDVSTGEGGVLAEPLMLRWHNTTAAAGGSRWLLGLCDSDVRPRPHRQTTERSVHPCGKERGQRA